MSEFKSLVASSAIAFSVAFTTPTAALEQIPLRDFFKNPEKQNFQVSQHGEYISYMQPWNNRMNVFVQKLSTDRLPTGEPQQITFVEDRDIIYYEWKGDSSILYMKDSGGDENFHVYAVDLNSGKEKDLTSFPNTRAWVDNILQDVSETDVLIASNQRDVEIFDIYRVNIKTGDSKLVGENSGNFVSWVADHDGVLRVAKAYDGLTIKIYHRPDEATEFKPILEYKYTDCIEPLLFTPDNKYLIATSNAGRDKQAIVKIDPENGNELEVLFEHPDVDVANINYSPYLKKITSASFVTWKQDFHFFDTAWKNRYEKIKAIVNDRQVCWHSSNHTEDLFTIIVTDDKTDGTSYLYNEKNGRMTLLYDTASYLPREKLGNMQPIEYIARDGLKIHGYLTLPQGSDGKNLPLIMHPHGGPHGARDEWRYQRQVQFLANRGYAVLQVNFRGSAGYGKDFYKKSFKQWGLAMQDDVTDGVNWAIAQGIADPERIGIFGASYGGYVTLAGITFTPDLYACAVDYVGVSNLTTLYDNDPPYWKPFSEQSYETMGHPIADREQFEATSPVFHADKIKAPLFVAHGANDPRVSIKDSNQIVEALRKRGVDVEYMVKENEGHGFKNEENCFEFYAAMEKFLEKHLKPNKPRP